MFYGKTFKVERLVKKSDREHIDLAINIDQEHLYFLGEIYFQYLQLT